MAKVKTLQERLADCKVFAEAIKKGETKRGCSVNTRDEGKIRYQYRKFSDHLMVENINEQSGRSYLIKILDSGEEDIAKQVCYDALLGNLRQNADVHAYKGKPRIYLNSFQKLVMKACCKK